MFKNNARNALIVILGVLAMLLAVMLVVSRSLGIILPLLVMIFVFARVCSRKEKTAEDAQRREVCREEIKEKPVKEEKSVNDSHKQDLEHIRAISSSLYMICCMDIRNIGMNAVRKAKDILRERYEENNSCSSFSQFENYYLPTLRRTVDNYCSMERKGIATLRMREDMIAYLKSCDQAFARVYSSMFEDDIFNMEVQMKAMNIALKRDGLL